MGREATCLCQIDQEQRDIKALLESEFLVLRTTPRTTVRFDAMSGLALTGDWLRFVFNGQRIGLALGAVEGAKWLKKISTPPPSLADKLGIKDGVKIAVSGKITEPILIDAIKGHVIKNADAADIMIGQASTDLQLQHAIQQHQLALGCPLWIVYPKGPKSSLGESRVRDIMRSSGYMDVKVSAVSQTLTATKYRMQVRA